MAQIGKKQKAALERRYGVRTGDGWMIERRSRRSVAGLARACRRAWIGAAIGGG
jgi:hypothetical protein